MKKLFITLLGVAVLFGSITPSLWATGPRAHTHEVEEEDEGTGCPICMTAYTPDSIVIQFDCQQKVNHHYCLDCVNAMDLANPMDKACPTCRSTYKVHDPRVNKNSYAYVHHRQKPLNVQEQNKLRAYLMRHTPSTKPAPDTVLRKCSASQQEVDKGHIIIELGCGHNLSLEEALKAARNKHQCPTCRKPMKIIDPLQKDGNDQVILKYLQRAPTKKESMSLQKIRSAASDLFQEHIPVERRVSATSKVAPKQTKKNVTFDIPDDEDDTIDGMTPDEFRKKFGLKQGNLRVLPDLYPIKDLTKEDAQLNKLLPKHLDPRDWQVVVINTGKREELACMKRAHRLPSRHSNSKVPHFHETTEEDTAPEFLKGSTGDLLGGLCLGLLVGRDYNKPDRFTPKSTWLVYSAAGLGAYTLVKKANPERSFELKQALCWAAGIGAGIAANAMLTGHSG